MTRQLNILETDQRRIQSQIWSSDSVSRARVNSTEPHYYIWSGREILVSGLEKTAFSSGWLRTADFGTVWRTGKFATIRQWLANQDEISVPTGCLTWCGKVAVVLRASGCVPGHDCDALWGRCLPPGRAITIHSASYRDAMISGRDLPVVRLLRRAELGYEASYLSRMSQHRTHEPTRFSSSEDPSMLGFEVLGKRRRGDATSLSLTRYARSHPIPRFDGLCLSPLHCLMAPVR